MKLDIICVCLNCGVFSLVNLENLLPSAATVNIRSAALITKFLKKKCGACSRAALIRGFTVLRLAHANKYLSRSNRIFIYY